MLIRDGHDLDYAVH